MAKIPTPHCVPSSWQPSGRELSGSTLLITLIGAGLAAFALRRAGLLGLAASAGSALLVARTLRAARLDGSVPLAMSHSITIDRPRKAIYRFWRNFANLPQFIENLQRVDVIDSRLSRWIMDAPLGQTVECDVEVTEDRANERIAWTATDRDIGHHGWVEFRDAGNRRGTEVRAMIVSELPVRQVGRTVARVFRKEPGEQVRDALWNLKKRIEDQSQDLPSR